MFGHYGCALLLSAMLGLCCRANTIFSDLGTAPVYDANVSYLVAGTSSPLQLHEQAAAFTSGVSEQLEEIDIALNFSLGSNAAIVDLMSDSGGVPGTVIESWNVSGLPVIGTCCTLQVLKPTSPIDLLAGTQYWVAALPGSTNTEEGWNQDSTGIGGTLAFNLGSGWDAAPANPDVAFAVQGVPEPAAAALMLVGLGALLLRNRSRL